MTTPTEPEIPEIPRTGIPSFLYFPLLICQIVSNIIWFVNNDGSSPFNLYLAINSIVMNLITLINITTAETEKEVTAGSMLKNLAKSCYKWTTAPREQYLAMQISFAAYSIAPNVLLQLADIGNTQAFPGFVATAGFLIFVRIGFTAFKHPVVWSYFATMVQAMFAYYDTLSNFLFLGSLSADYLIMTVILAIKEIVFALMVCLSRKDSEFKYRGSWISMIGFFSLVGGFRHWETIPDVFYWTKDVPFIDCVVEGLPMAIIILVNLDANAAVFTLILSIVVLLKNIYVVYTHYDGVILLQSCRSKNDDTPENPDDAELNPDDADLTADDVAINVAQHISL